jgi:hypothetical protein
MRIHVYNVYNTVHILFKAAESPLGTINIAKSGPRPYEKATLNPMIPTQTDRTPPSTPPSLLGLFCRDGFLERERR